jgi:peptidoglycan/xylan/chitin deacetylase (PgdA/CDA1 family)
MQHADREDPPQVWPDSARCAVAFTFDFDAEEVWIGEDPTNAIRPGVLSQGTYGANVGVPLVLDLLHRHEVQATFFVPGRVAERHPDRVERILASGHELGHHGYTHRSPALLSAVEEEEELLLGKQILEDFGTTVSGYRSPSWNFSAVTTALLAKHGFEYSSNLMDDLWPYQLEGTSIIELPVHWMLDDAPHFWFAEASWTKKISTTAEVRAIWEEEFLGIRELGGCCIFTLHPQFIGRPSRLQLLAEIIEVVRDAGDAWCTTCGELATWVRTSHEQSGAFAMAPWRDRFLSNPDPRTRAHP